MYGLIGKKLGHSFSADFFNEKFRNEGLDEVYRLFPIPSVDDVTELIHSHPSLKGLNVTIPYKQQIVPLLDFVSEDAARIGAVNVVKVIKKWDKIFLEGYNSDWIGFRDSLQPLLSPEMRKALVLGTGGASRAVAYALESLGITVTKVSREKKEGTLLYDELTPDIIREHLIIVNTTPLGMWPDIDTGPPLPYNAMTPSHLCYDLVYNPDETLFMKKSNQYGAVVKNGLEMLHLQAIAAWNIWVGE